MPALYRRDSFTAFEQDAYPTYFDDQLYLVWYPPYEEPSDDDDEEEQQEEEGEGNVGLARSPELEPSQRVPHNTPVSQAVDRGEGSGDVEMMKLDGKGEASGREEAKKQKKKKTAGDVVDEAIESRFLLESTAEDEENESEGGGEGLGDEETCCEEHRSGWFSQDGRFVCQ